VVKQVEDAADEKQQTKDCEYAPEENRQTPKILMRVGPIPAPDDYASDYK
jgi:hypothetical protein